MCRTQRKQLMQVIDISNEPNKTIEFYRQIVEDDEP